MPLNKVGKYCKGKEGNITLLVEYNNVKTLAILDNKGGIAIAAKIIWEAWRKHLQNKDEVVASKRAHGTTLELLKGVPITTCGIQFILTFTMVDSSL